MTHVPPRSIAAMTASQPADERPRIAVLVARIVAALLPPPRLVARVGHATLTHGPIRRG